VGKVEGDRVWCMPYNTANNAEPVSVVGD